MTQEKALALQTKANKALLEAQLQIEEAQTLMIQANNAYLSIARLATLKAEANEDETASPDIMELIASADEDQQRIITQIQARYKSKLYYILPYDLIQDLIHDDTIRARGLQLKFNTAEAKITANNIHDMFTSTRGLKIFKNSHRS